MMSGDKTPLNIRQILVFGVIVYFTFIGGSFYSDLNFPLRVLNQIIVTALLGSWLLSKLRRGEPFPRTSLDGPFLAWLAAHFIAALFGLSPRFSLEKLWTPVTHILAFYLLVDLRRKGHTVTVARGLYMSAAVVCLVGLAEFASWYVGLPLLPQFVQGWPAVGGLRHPFPPISYRLNFTLNGATPLSAYLALLIPPALGIWLTARQRDDRHAIAGWLVLAFIVEGLSFSRGGVLALLVSLPMTGLGWWLARRGDDPLPWKGACEVLGRVLRRTRRPVAIGAIVIVLVLTVLIGSTWLRGTFADRSGSTQFRFTLWDIALASFCEHPLTGVGPCNFGRSLLQRNDPALPRFQITTAHSIYLNTAAELGLVGLAAGGWLLLAVGRAWLVRWRSASGVADRMHVVATGAALAGLAAQCLVDTFTATPHVLPILAIAAFVLTDSKEMGVRRHSAPILSQASNYMALLIVVLYIVGLAWLDSGQFYFQRSVNLAGRGNLTDAVVAAEQARRLDPTMPLYTFQSAYLQGRMADQPNALATAIGLYQAGLAAEPVDGRQTANLAATLWQAGNREAAIEALTRAIAVEPDPIYLVNLGYFYQQVGEVDRAVETYGQALAKAPGLAASDFWQAVVGQAAGWPDILNQAETAVQAVQGDVTRWHLEIALAQGDWPAASTYAQTALADMPGDCGGLSVLARAWFETGKISEAGDLAQQAVDANRACSNAYLVRGLVRQAAGDLAGAETDWRIAHFLGQPQAAYYLGQLYQARGDTETAARFYASALSPSAVSMDVEITLYDRRAAFDLLPPLFRIGVGAEQAKPWLALARLCEAQGNFEAARQIYQALLLEDPYLAVAQERLDALPRGQ